jgi:hypothetical protein
LLSTAAKRLIKYGFINEKHKLAPKFIDLKPSERENKLQVMSDKEAEGTATESGLADIEWAEEYLEIFMMTEYPQPAKRYWLAFESPNLNIEEMYFWLHHQLSTEQGYETIKVIDTYAASEASSFFGLMQQRLSIQQGNISNFLKGISDMVKGLFQIVREVRILSDRMQYYTDTFEQNENALSSEIVLKGLWVDQVEGGTKNPSSVYGLAQNVGFTILPDIFFRVAVKGPKEVDSKVDELQFNEKVKEILKRKLRQYYEWKTRTFKELETRKKFELKYLKQHYETIRLYISWIKPYLRYTKRMQQLEKLELDSRLIKSFEGAFVEIEVLAKRKSGEYNAVVLFNFQYRSRPETLIHQPHEYGQKGPVHIGRGEARLRVYSWTDDEIKNYISYKQEEDIALLSAIDESIKEAMDSLGDELKKYLGMEGEVFNDEKKIHDLAQNLLANNIVPNFDEGLKKAKGLVSATKEKPKLGGAADPFIAVFKGFGEIFGAFGLKDIKFGSGKMKVNTHLRDKSKDFAKENAKKCAWLVFKNYKKAHKMLTW